MNPEKLFDDITGFVADSRKLLKAGQVVELAGMENRVLALCEEVLLLSQDQRIHYEKRLNQLFSDLEALERELVEQRDSVGEKMRSLPQLKKATVAYKVVDASDRKGDD